jgi:S1-C subfamily serine protease
MTLLSVLNCLGSAAPLFAATQWAEKMGLQLDGSLAVTGLAPAGFARVIGVAAGDRVTALNGVVVRDPAAFQRTAAAMVTGRPQVWVWELTVDRGGRSLRLAPQAGFNCNPYTLIGCGDLPP